MKAADRGNGQDDCHTRKVNGSTPIDDRLLAKYIAGEADAQERERVEVWLNETPDNHVELERMRSVWNWSGEAVAQPLPDVDAAWHRLQRRMDAPSGTLLHLRPMRRWLVAAAVLGALALTLRWWFQPASVQLVAERGYLSSNLRDSSRVVLSPGTRMIATMGDERTVQLVGEAYFEVEPDQQRPFIIQADGLEVRVLGTAFTVSAYDTSLTWEVRVREGRVRTTTGTDTLVLLAGDHVRVDKSNGKLVRTDGPATRVWGERIIQFQATTMDEVVALLERMFSVDIEWSDPAFANCKLTATFENEPIERILEVIGETFGSRIERTGPSTYLITGDGCG